MPFKQQDGVWVPDLPEYPLGTAVSAGDWNQGPGGGRFIPEMRDELTLAQKVENMYRAGCTHIEFHDTEAPRAQAKQFTKIVHDGGLKIHMCTANLFRRPEFVGSNFASRDADVRKAAIEYTKDYIDVGINIFDADVYVYWNGSNGIVIPLATDYMGAYKRTAECLQEILEWMIKTYGPEKALCFAFEPKPNEPPGWSIPADVGEAMAIISMLPTELQPFIGFNPETCHSQMGGKRYAMELGLSASLGKLFYTHLNGGSENPKFDEDRAFGDINFSTAVEIVYTLKEIGYNYVVGLDVQPLPGDTNEQQAESIARSIRNLKRALACCKRIDSDELNALRDKGDQAGIADLFSRAVSGVE